MAVPAIGEIVVLGDRIEWTLKDFVSRASGETWITSKEFCFKRQNCVFSLTKPLKKWTDDPKNSWLELRFVPFGRRGFSRYSVHFSIRKECGGETESSSAHYNKTCFANTEFMRWDTFVEKEDQLIPNGHLTVVCRIRNVGEELAKEKSRLDFCVSFVDGFKTMFESGEFCDFDVKVQDRTFRTHKLVLAAQSSVFASMLRHDLQEKKTGMVEIVDCDWETFETFLKFLYGGKKEVIIPGNVVSLYEVADKYDVQNLKAECRRFMMKNLSTELFCDVICLALKHEERELIKHATKYFKSKKKNIFLSVQWQSFLKENSTCANEFLIKSCK